MSDAQSEGSERSAAQGLAVAAPSCDLRDDVFAGRALARRDEDPRARLGQPERNVAADAAPAAGYQGGAAREVEELGDPHGAPW